MVATYSDECVSVLFDQKGILEDENCLLGLVQTAWLVVVIRDLDLKPAFPSPVQRVVT